MIGSILAGRKGHFFSKDLGSKWFTNYVKKKPGHILICNLIKKPEKLTIYVPHNSELEI